VADEQIVGSQLSFDAVEGGEFFDCAGAPHQDFFSGQTIEIEGVQRLAGFEHDVVGRIDDRVDRANAAGFQAVAQPGRRRRHGDAVHEPRGVARAEARVLDLQRAAPVSAATSRAIPARLRQSPRLGVTATSKTQSSRSVSGSRSGASDSTSRPERVRSFARSPGERSMATNSASQLNVNFMPKNAAMKNPPLQAG